MPIRVGMILLGCPKNQVDAEGMLARLKEPDFNLVSDAEQADVIIINTCGFIEDAKKESIENILETGLLKKEGKIKGIVVTGCLAQRYLDEMSQEFPEVNCIVQVGRSGDIEKAVRVACEGGRLNLGGSPEELAFGGGRTLTTPSYYAYLKIAEGCDNRCTYCIIPELRGRYRSRPMEELVAEAQGLVQGGVRELILVAQDTTRYGQDLYGKLKLPELLEELCRIKELRWIRLLYCYPDRMSDELIETIARKEKIVKYIDLPIQHVSPSVVRAMNRHMDDNALRTLIAKLRTKIPGLTLRTTLIVGFPGETQKDFEQLIRFVKDIKFERLGAFAYSQEEGTPAAGFDGQIDEQVKFRRQEIVMEEQLRIASRLSSEKIGETVEVLTEGFDSDAGYYVGRSCADAPEIDGKVYFKSIYPLSPGNFTNIRVKDASDFDIKGEALPPKGGMKP